MTSVYCCMLALICSIVSGAANRCQTKPCFPPCSRRNSPNGKREFRRMQSPHRSRVRQNAACSLSMKHASAISQTTRAMLGFAADWPLLTKVQTIDSFLGRDYFHESGIMYCMWRWKGDELRPYRDEDFEGQQPFVRPGMTAAGQMDNENSTFISGFFLWSQCL